MPPDAAMVRKRVLVPLLATANVLVLFGFALVIAPLAFVDPCPELQLEEGGLGLDSSSPAPSPGPAAAGSDGSCEDAGACVCLRVSIFVVLAVSCLVGLITGEASSRCYEWLVDGEGKEEAKMAGYVGDLEVAGTGAGGGKN